MISIINYKMGNIRSIRNALDFINVRSRVVSTPNDILNAERLILPGVGSFRTAMENINYLGFYDVLNEAVLKKKVPILGICLGMQLFAEEGEEDGLNKGLGWIPGRVTRFSSQKFSIKVPHIGFNTVSIEKDTKGLFVGLSEEADFYFVHSYRMICSRPEKYVSSWTFHGESVAASIQKENIIGTQFHPEKSQSNGLTVLKNFCRLGMD